MSQWVASRSWSSAAVGLAVTVLGGTACISQTPPGPETDDAPVPATTERAASSDQSEAPDGIVNYTRVDATVACAGATPPRAMAGLKTLGFVSVINFRTPEERGATVAEGRAAAETAGLTYVHLPFREPNAEVVEQFLETVTDPTHQPVYIHCGSANRVGTMWLIKRIRVDGWSADKALAEAGAIGLQSEAFKEFALQYVGADGV